MKIINELVDLANKANISGQGTPDMVEFRVVANPDNILAIAEAFRYLEQRAEEAEAKLAELEKQKPRYQIQKKPSYGRESVWIDVASREEAETNVLHGYRWRMVYDAPAPAANLAAPVQPGWKLVPENPTEEMIIAVSKGLAERVKPSRYKAMLSAAPILRNIEEAKLDKQRNPDYFLNRIESSDEWGPEVELRIYESQLDASKSQDDHGGGIIKLFTRPASAINLAELVPSIEALRAEFEEVERKSDDGFNLHRYDTVYADDETQERWDLWLSCRAAILRNIEEAK